MGETFGLNTHKCMVRFPTPQFLKRSFLCEPSRNFIIVAAAAVLLNNLHIKKKITCSMVGSNLGLPVQHPYALTIRPQSDTYFYRANAN